MPEVLIKPTIGRRIWYWPGYLDLAVPGSPMRLISDQAAQPFDAGVIYVHSDTCVNLQVTDHMGGIWFREKVRILQEGESSAVIHEEGIAEWMNYQVGAAAREKENALPPASPQAKDVMDLTAQDALRISAAALARQGDHPLVLLRANAWEQVWDALTEHAPRLVHTETSEPSVVRAVRAIETLAKHFAKSCEYKRVNEGVLYPAIRNAMALLGKFPADHNVVVDQAFNKLYDAYWSETPAPASAAPKRTIHLNPVTGARRDPRDIESDPYATLCVSATDAAIPAEPASHATALSETAWRQANALEKQTATDTAIPAELVDTSKPVAEEHQSRACKGERCGSTTGRNHSPECIAEAAIAQGWPDDIQRRGAMRQAEQAYKDRDAEFLALGKVTEEYLLGEIRSEFYFTAEDGVLGESELGTSPAKWTGLDRVTFCVLLSHNGVKLVGINYGSLQAGEFDKDKARTYARNDAVRALREHLAFRLRDLQHRARLQA